mmetsp:Transcript_11498/g.70716  ORF Transcript_11498/g.70716 Transcript_11498/m.70716 type:complete len:200 (-) Transcript_11498:1860-2459(-)
MQHGRRSRGILQRSRRGTGVGRAHGTFGACFARPRGRGARRLLRRCGRRHGCHRKRRRFGDALGSACFELQARADDERRERFGDLRVWMERRRGGGQCRRMRAQLRRTTWTLRRRRLWRAGFVRQLRRGRHTCCGCVLGPSDGDVRSERRLAARDIPRPPQRIRAHGLRFPRRRSTRRLWFRRRTHLRVERHACPSRRS